MSKEHPSSNLQMIPIDKIEVLNPRDRNSRIFDDIVGNIKDIGLKKPITVTPRKDSDGNEKFLLICGYAYVVVLPCPTCKSIWYKTASSGMPTAPITSNA